MSDAAEARGDDMREEMRDVPPPQRVCPNCQAETDEGATECPTCGFDLAGANRKQEEGQS
jgi:predicted amidophosphoribosyltransferase